ncbi:hypothetical protein CVS40_0116 [Lucilia cuprina]|nr:hypothetical protein CVS40_0116 [Lucilia cuprina]
MQLFKRITLHFKCTMAESICGANDANEMLKTIHIQSLLSSCTE